MSSDAPPQIPDVVLDDLRRRLREFAPVPLSPADGRDRGVDPAALADLDVRSWQEFERGGHFAAWERPHDYLEGVRAALELAADET